jgi:hypothetical protein
MVVARPKVFPIGQHRIHSNSTLVESNRLRRLPVVILERLSAILPHTCLARMGISKLAPLFDAAGTYSSSVALCVDHAIDALHCFTWVQEIDRPEPVRSVCRIVLWDHATLAFLVTATRSLAVVVDLETLYE